MNSKEMELYEGPDKVFKITIIKMITQIKETMHGQNENF